MKPIAEMPRKARENLRGILCDLDDTLTLQGKLVPQALQALFHAKQSGLRVVVVTGRPAGWADHIARMWPVDAVIGENGAFYFHMDRKAMRRRYVENEVERKAQKLRLAKLAQQIPQQIKGAKVAADQFCRATDLAIDFCEDVLPLGDDAIDGIVEIFQHAGATAKVSSIHVNGWFGDYDKLRCTKLMARELWHEDLDDQGVREQYIYCGDSPNDEPMFAFFPFAVAVANIMDFLPRITHHPAFVTSELGGAGFVELIDHILTS